MNAFEKEVIERLASIEADLKHHIKRTDELQTFIDKVEKRYWWVIGGLIVLVTGLKIIG